MIIFVIIRFKYKVFYAKVNKGIMFSHLASIDNFIIFARINNK